MDDGDEPKRLILETSNRIAEMVQRLGEELGNVVRETIESELRPALDECKETFRQTDAILASLDRIDERLDRTYCELGRIRYYPVANSSLNRVLRPRRGERPFGQLHP